MERNGDKIFEEAVYIYTNTDYDCEESVDAAIEIWDRAHGVYVEQDELDESKPAEPSPGSVVEVEPSIEPSTHRAGMIAMGVIAILIASGVAYLWYYESHKPDLTCAIVHRLSNGKCPDGYAVESFPRFRENDGSLEYGCVSYDISKRACTDVLRPGESETMQFTIPKSSPKDNDEDDPVEVDGTKRKSHL